MRHYRTLILLGSLLALPACLSFGGADPPDQLMTLTPAAAIQAQASRTATAAETITVLTPTVPQELATLRVPVRTSDTSLAYLKDAQWVEMPASLFGRLLSETIGATTGRVVLDPRQFSLDPGIRLSGQLQSFGLDSTSMEVVAVYDAALARGADRVETRRFEARVPVSEDSAAAVAPALNQAANQLAADVAKWVG
jgi:cholesterol transport system auxiliary component